MKKYLAVLIVLGILFAFTPQVKASTLDDLMNQIKSLSEQISGLQSQISALVITGLQSITINNLSQQSTTLTSSLLLSPPPQSGPQVVYVVDMYNNRIQIFNTDGSYFSSFGSIGSGNG